MALRREAMAEHLVAAGLANDDDYHRQSLDYAYDCASVVLLDGTPVGLAKVRKAAPAWEIIQLQIASGLRGQGWGCALMQQIIQDARADGADVSLSVLKANPARRLYERMGFVVVGEDERDYCMYRRTG